MTVRGRLVLVGIWIGLVVGWLMYQRSTGLGPVDTAQRFVDAARGVWWALPVFVGLYTIRPLVFFPTTLMTIAGGIVFGPVLGVAATIVGANASAMVAYWAARSLSGERWLIRPPTGRITRYAVRLRERSFATVLTMRLLFLPYDLVHYSAGVVRIRPMPFLAATAIGSLPATLSFVLAGASVERIDDGPSGLDLQILAASATMFVLSLGLAWWMHRRERVQQPTTSG